MSTTAILVRYRQQRLFSIARESDLGSLEGSGNTGERGKTENRIQESEFSRRFHPSSALLQARLQSPSNGPLGPTVGSDLGKTKWAIRSVMAAVGASRQMSQFWSGG